MTKALSIPKPGGLVQFAIPPDKMEWDDPSDLQAFTANNANVVNLGGQLHISFYEMIPPVVITPAQQAKVKTVRAVGKCRLVVSPQLAADLVRLLQEQIAGMVRR